MRWLGLGIGLGLGLAAWRNAPPVLYPQHEAFAVVVIVCVLGLFFGRRSKRGATATAVAVAEATAVAGGGDARVQVVNVQMPQGVSASAAWSELDDMPWIDPTARPALEAEVLGELVAEHTDERDLMIEGDPNYRWLDL